MIFQRWGLRGVATVAALCIGSVAWATTITGVVTTSKDAKPVAGATVIVRLSYDGSNNFTKPIQTGSNGQFSVEVAEEAESAEVYKKYGFAVFVSAPGYGMVQTAGKAGEPLAIALLPERTVRGMVKDTAGKPVAGAVVSLEGVISRRGNDVTAYMMLPGPLVNLLTTKTDTQGRWQLGGIPSREANAAEGEVTLARVTLTDPRFISGTLLVTVDDPAKKEAILAARAGGTITGRVMSNARQVAGIRVIARVKPSAFERQGQIDTGILETTTNDAGAFRLPNVGDGTYFVVVDADKQEEVAPAATGVVVKGEKEVILAAPFVLTSGSILEGKVVGKGTGKPVPGVYLYASGPHAPGSSNGVPLRTGADGTFRVRVAAGENSVRIGSVATGYVYTGSSVTTMVREGVTKTLPPFEMSEALAVALRVTDEAGKPVAELPILIRHANGSGQYFEGARKTGTDGSWNNTDDFWGQPAADDKEPWLVHVPKEWEVVSPLELKLPSATPITVVVRKADLSKRAVGRVVTPEGKPIAGVNVGLNSWIKDAKGNRTDFRYENWETDKEGRFILSLLRPNSEVSVRGGKAEHRALKPVGGEKTVTIPEDGKQPVFEDWVLTPLTGSVSGKMTNKTGKPVAGAWVWSFDGDGRCLARTDAKGAFNIKHLPLSGEVGLFYAAGSAHGTYSATKRTNIVLPVTATAKPALSAPAQETRRRHAINLVRKLAEQDEPGQGVRKAGYGHDALANLVAPFNLPLALSLIRGRDGKTAETNLGGMLEIAARHAPEAVRTLYLKEKDTWNDPTMRYYRHIDMGMAFSGREPAFARACYDAALMAVGDGVDNNDGWALRQRMKLAFRLKADEADTLFGRVVELTRQESRDADSARIDALRYAADGDGVLAAKYVADVSQTKREIAAVTVLQAMMEEQPLEAKKLLEGWIADGTLKSKDNEGSGNYVGMFTRLAKSLAVFDAEGAAWIVRQTPEDRRWQSALYAVSAARDPATRRRQYREAIDSDSGWDKLKRYAACFDVARRNGDTAVVAEMRAELVRYLASGSGAFNGDMGTNAAALTYQLSDTMPDLCRMLLEIAIHQSRELNPNYRNDFWLIQTPMQAMAWVDLPRALQLADGLQKPEDVAHAKREIVRALLTPPDKWASLVGQ